MLTIDSPAEMRRWSAGQRAAGHTIGLVPTMGALHPGHLALIEEAGRRADVVVVSVFVNPLQFNEPADFDGYPRPIDDDVAACAHAGVGAVYAPTASVMYPAGFQTTVTPGPLGDVMEGPGRPGHFAGVLTVVAKLFGAVDPDTAVFGQKDYQQLRIVTQMVEDLDLGIEIIGHPIVRESDGLARSSRNLRLGAAQRTAAVCVPAALAAAVDAARSTCDTATIEAAARAVVDAQPDASLEYVEVFDAGTLEAVEHLSTQHRSPNRVRVAIAVWFGDIRLIDNRDLFAG